MINTQRGDYQMLNIVSQVASEKRRAVLRAAMILMSMGSLMSGTAVAAEQYTGGPAPSAELSAFIKKHSCNACHGIDEMRIGPPFRAVAMRYRGMDDQVISMLENKIRDGGAGNWGVVPMIPYPDISADQVSAAVRGILDLAPAAETKPKEKSGKKKSAKK